MEVPRPSTGQFRVWPLWAAPALVGIIAFVLVAAAIDPAGDYPSAPEGPGLTIDEVFNVEEGVRLVEGLPSGCWAKSHSAKSSRYGTSSPTRGTCRMPASAITTPTIRRLDGCGWESGTR